MANVALKSVIMMIVMVPFKEALIEVLPRKCHHEECHYDNSHGAIQRGINGRQREVKVCEDSTMDKL